MDDRQLALLLTALSDQTAAMNRMADALTGMLMHLDPKQAAKFAAPGYMRPLAAYATFDWHSIDATVIAFDRHGATEVEHNGVAYRRYRSNEDDPKGIDIRFRRVMSGTVEGKDMVWATLIKFADKKAKDAPRPLRGELAEKIEHAAGGAKISGSSVLEAHGGARGGGKTITQDAAQSLAEATDNSSLMTNNSPPAEPVVDTPTSSPLSAEQIKADLVEVKLPKSNAMRPIDDIARHRVYLALKAACGSDDSLHQVIGYLFGRTTFKAVTSAEAWTLQGWLKPTQNASKQWIASNPRATEEIDVILQLEAVPA